MNINNHTFSKGDTCFLFTNFPLDHGSVNTKPLKIHDGIYLAWTPVEALNHQPLENKNENIALIEWVYPGYHLNMGVCYASIKIDSSVSPEIGKKYFWTFITALFLIKPLKIDIGGSFTYGDSVTGFINNPGKFDLRSNVIYENLQGHRYNEQDIEMAKQIFPLLLNANNPKLIHSIQLFKETFFFEKLSLERSIYSRLFALLDSLAGNHSNNRGQSISKRLGDFLTNIPIDNTNKYSVAEIVTQRVATIWKEKRNTIMHGDLPTSTTINLIKFSSKDLKDLAEVTRLTFLKLLLLNKENLEEYHSMMLNNKEDKQTRDKKINDFFREPYPNQDKLIFYSDLKTA